MFEDVDKNRRSFFFFLFTVCVDRYCSHCGCFCLQHANICKDGRQTADSHGQREAQQEYHAKGKRQIIEEHKRREGLCWPVAPRAIHFCCLRFSNIPDYSEHQDGHVKKHGHVSTLCNSAPTLPTSHTLSDFCFI